MRRAFVNSLLAQSHCFSQSCLRLDSPVCFVGTVIRFTHFCYSRLRDYIWGFFFLFFFFFFRGLFFFFPGGSSADPVKLHGAFFTLDRKCKRYKCHLHVYGAASLAAFFPEIYSMIITRSFLFADYSLPIALRQKIVGSSQITIN